MDLDKETVKNILKMLRSPDEENSYLAFQSLENMPLKDKIGEVIVLYKYSRLGLTVWQEASPKCYKILSAYFDNNKTLTGGECLSIMTSKNASKASIELFLEMFVTDMVDMLDNLGYPTDKFDLQITLKDE
jgi:hypothetical protein